MANLRIKGDVSGYVDLVSPDVAGSTTIALDKIVVADASGSIEIGNSSSTFSQQVIRSSTTGIGELRFGDDIANAGYLKYDHNSNQMIFATNATAQMYISSNGNVGIGTTSPEAKLHVAGQILAGSGAGTNLILDDGVESAKWGLATGGYNLTFQKNNGSGVYQERGRIDQNGNLTVPGYISGGPGSVVQEVVMETNVLTSFSTVNAWGEPSTSYRLNITPKFSDSLIVLHYFVPLNQYSSGANNIFVFRSVRYSPNSSHLITSAGQQAGSSRMRVAGGAARAQNGYDINDQNLEGWIAYDRPATTSQCTYGFEIKQETSDSGTIYIGYSNSDNGTWGYASRVIITAREIRQ